MRLIEVDPTVDIVFKWLFGVDIHVRFLLALINAVLEKTLDRPLVSVQILNPYDERSNLDDKLSILDIRAVDDRSRLFNIEMQMSAFRHYLQRALFYWASVFQGQLAEGEVYSKLQPTIGIHFVDAVLFPETANHHLVFDLRERQQPEITFGNHMQLHVIEFPKFNVAKEEIRTPLDQWLYFFKNAVGLDLDGLPSFLESPIMTEALEVLSAMGNSPQQRILYESRLKAKRDYESGLAFAKEEGIQIGRQDGIQIGRQDGIQIGRRNAIENCIEVKFGVSSAPLARAIERVTDADQLKKMLEDVVKAGSIDELVRKWK